MNKFLMSLLFGTFILTGPGFAQTPPPAAAPATTTITTTTTAPEAVTAPAHHMHHPEIHKAMRKLRGAKADLEKASHDYGGHKEKAIAAIDAALVELKAALDFESAKQ